MLSTHYATGGGSSLAILGGGLVPFVNTVTSYGGAVTSNGTSFVMTQAGYYRLTYRMRSTILSALATVQVLQNGVSIGESFTLISAGSELVDTVTFAASPGDEITLQVQGLLTLTLGGRRSITIDKIAP